MFGEHFEISHLEFLKDVSKIHEILIIRKNHFLCVCTVQGHYNRGGTYQVKVLYNGLELMYTAHTTFNIEQSLGSI